MSASFITSSIEEKFKNVLEKKGNKNVKVKKIVDIIYDEIVERTKKGEYDISKNQSNKLKMKITFKNTSQEEEEQQQKQKQNFAEKIKELDEEINKQDLDINIDPMSIIPDYTIPKAATREFERNIVEIEEHERCHAYVWASKNDINPQCDRRIVGKHFCSIHNIARPYGEISV